MLADWLPDVVVLDALMPGLDGFETCRALRALPGFESLPVLMLTGLDDDASITRAYEAGATDFFVKSTQWSLLAGRLRYLLRASRTRVELERSKSQAGARAGPGAHGQLRLAARPGRAACSRSRACACSASGPATRSASARCCAWCREDERSGFLRAAARRAATTASVLATDIPVDAASTAASASSTSRPSPSSTSTATLIGYTGIVQDVTDRRMAEDQIRHLANFDALTGLPNRRQLIWRAERALEQARRLGHQVGAAADRPRPLQGHQRHARPRRRRRAADGGRRAGCAPACATPTR